jgi:hypothetical protein
MREHHPDQATNDGFDSTAFCALLNQIYQVGPAVCVCVGGGWLDDCCCFSDGCWQGKGSWPGTSLTIRDLNSVIPAASPKISAEVRPSTHPVLVNVVQDSAHKHTLAHPSAVHALRQANQFK